jgi:hypothetical protein
MMKQMVLVGSLVAMSAALTGSAWAQAGHTAPKPQPATADAPSVPTGEMPLGTVHLPKPAKADGKTLPAGTYQVRLTSQTASPEAKGQTPTAERWVEFVKGGKVVGREVVTIVAKSEASAVQKDAPPPANGAKVQTLKGGEYERVWINRGGNYYLIHLPTA